MPLDLGVELRQQRFGISAVDRVKRALKPSTFACDITHAVSLESADATGRPPSPLALFVLCSSRDVPPTGYCFHACKRERCAEAGVLHALLLLGKPRLEPVVALDDARLARLRAVCSRGARFSSEIRAGCGVFEGPGLRGRAGRSSVAVQREPGVLFAPSALGRRSRGARES
jgi:hypothetical protein